MTTKKTKKKKPKYRWLDRPIVTGMVAGVFGLAVAFTGGALKPDPADCNGREATIARILDTHPEERSVLLKQAGEQTECSTQADFIRRFRSVGSSP